MRSTKPLPCRLLNGFFSFLDYPVLIITLLIGLKASSQCVSTFEMILKTSEVSGADEIVNAGDGQFYVCARKFYPQNSKTTLLIVKMDTLGTVLWQSEYDINNFSRDFHGVIGSNWTKKYKLTADKGLIVVGANSSHDFKDSIICLQLHPDGSVAWCKKFGSEYGIAGIDILQTSDGGFVVSGTASSNLMDAFIMKLDASGNAQWGKRFRSPITNGDNSLGGGVIEKNNTIYFCSSLEAEDLGAPDHLYITQLSLLDGSLKAGTGYLPTVEGFGTVKIYDDLHDGFYVTGIANTYRSPTRQFYVLRLDNALKLIKSYHVANNFNVGGGFAVLKDGFASVGCTCGGNSPHPSYYIVNKVKLDGTLAYSGRFPLNVDSYTTIANADRVGENIILAGRRGDNTLIASLNANDPSKNNCDITDSDGETTEQGYVPISITWRDINDMIPGAMDIAVDVTPSQVTSDTVCYFSCLQILPMLLKEFKGFLEGRYINLYFTTVNEINTAKIDIERSYDGSTFSPIGRFDAQERSGSHSYKFIDSNYAIGAYSKVYYRIKMKRKDGSFQSSSIISFSLNAYKNTDIIVSPNPAKQLAVLQLDVDNSELITVNIRNVLGQVVLTQKEKGNRGRNTIMLQHINTLRPGIYFVEVLVGKQYITKRLLVD